MKYKIFKSDLAKFINDINNAMTKNKTFYNVKVSEIKNNDKMVFVKIG